jgi:flavin reductase (DIM6/NTAB) family NADH-FMN oxidoreductase RutF
MAGAFDRLVAAMDGAMVAVTVAAGREVDGCLVGFHSQCSIDPPRYAVWLSRANRTHELAGAATHLAVHLLPAGQWGLAALLGGTTGDEVDKLAAIPWEVGPGGVPLLDPLPSRFVGEIAERVTGDGRGDHDLFVLDVVSAEGPPASPLRLSEVSDLEPGHDASDPR